MAQPEIDSDNSQTLDDKHGHVSVIPADPGILRELKEELVSPAPSAELVTRLVFQDPAIAIGLAQNCYSVQQGIGDPFSLTNPWQMIVRLGVEKVNGLLDIIGSRPLPATFIREEVNHQRGRAMRIAQMSRAIMRQVNPQFGDAGELIGLLGGIGNLLAVLVLRDRFIAIMEETSNQAKATYRFLKEHNFNIEKFTSDFLRLNGIPEKFITCTERETKTSGTPAQVELRTAFLSALELATAFEEGKEGQYVPEKTLPAMSSLRLLQLKEQAYAKLYSELVQINGETHVTVVDLSTDPMSAPSPKSSPQSPVGEIALPEDALDSIVINSVDEKQSADHLEVKPIGTLTPSAARIKRIQKLRMNSAARSSTAGETSGESAAEFKDGLDSAVGMVDAVIRDHPVITNCIRGIRNVELLYGKGHLSKIRDLAVAVVKPISDRASRYQAALYFATVAYYPHLLEGRKKIDLDEAIGMLLPSEISSVVALTYLSYQLGLSVNQSEWKSLIRPMGIHIDIGRSVGAAVPGLNGGVGMLLGGIRFISLGVLLARSPSIFAEYRAELKNSKKLFDTGLEIKKFGTTHLEIGAVILQRFGFGAALASEFLPSALLADETMVPRALNWMESIHQSGTPFTARERAPQLGVQRPELVQLRDKVQLIVSSEKPCSWLMREKSDLLIDGRCKVPKER